MGIQQNAGFIMARRVLPTITTALFLFILAGFSAPVSLGGDFWIDKDFTKWSKNECMNILTNSPWARQFTLTLSRPPGGDWIVGDGSATHTVTYQMQLYSALPIRQAIVRQGMIAQNYEQLLPEEKNRFDKKAEEMVSAGSNDVIVLRIFYTTSHPPYDLDLARYWQMQTTETLKSSTYLQGSKRVKVPISSYIVFPGVQREFRFIFPRKYDGHDLLGPNDKSLLLEFGYPTYEDMGKSKMGFMEFKALQLMFKGKIEY